ncbi:MAG: allophanate hydrolase, partial [Pseudomonadota bacterium]
MLDDQFVPTITNVRQGYTDGDFTPRQLVEFLQQRAQQYTDRNIWISLIEPAVLEVYLSHLESIPVDSLPLYGVPFAAKDNIDIQGFTTTAGCPEFAFDPTDNASITGKLIEAGAIPLGKTNLDQFATGLVGTRSPHGPCGNAFDPAYISGGSSSGSAVAVSLGLVSFSLGTDTAGSGRVPAMLNNLVGLKPSRGLFSMTGVVPACRSLDCPSVFALNTEDAAVVFDVAARFDVEDAYSRANPFSNSVRHFGATLPPAIIGVPKQEQREFYGDENAAALFEESLTQWQALGAEIIEIDFTPLLSAARLLYEGPWVAERYAALEELINTTTEVIHPVVRGIVEGANGKTAVETFKAEYQMQEYRAYTQQVFSQVDMLLTPTAPRHYLIEEVLADPVRLNSNMGHYTNFMNLLDLCGVAIPAGFLPDGKPFGISLVAPAFRDVELLNHARAWQHTLSLPTGTFTETIRQNENLTADAAHQSTIDIAVCGAHLKDFPLNWQLRERGATLKQTTTTSATYKLFLLSDFEPPRPGLIRTAN